MSEGDFKEILTAVNKTNEHISDIYSRIDGIKDNQFAMQQSLFDLSQTVQQNQLNDFNTKEEITKKVEKQITQEVEQQIQIVAKKHGGSEGKKWGGIGTIAAAVLVAAFKTWEKLFN
jgi:hypothetical protein